MSTDEQKQNLVSNEPLFRREALAGREAQWLGPILLEPRISHRIYAYTAGIAFLAILVLFVAGTFTRKARVSGWLMPEAGMVRVFTPQAGIIQTIDVKEGQVVKQGAPLVALSSEVHSDAGTATKAEIIARLRDRRDSLTNDLKTQQQLFDQQGADLEKRLKTTTDSQEHLARELAILDKRVQLSGQTLKRGQALRAQDLISLVRFEQIQQDNFDLQMKVESIRREQSSLTEQRTSTEGEMRQLPLKRDAQIASVKRDIFLTDQQLADAKSQRELVLTAPRDGTVTGIQTEIGGNASPATPLMSIVPSDQKLEANLYGPSRAIGFIRPGQKVLLRYQAYPYQKFGLQDGTVASVSKTAVNPAEFTQQLAGLAAVYGTSEPLYRITVQLDKQSVLAYGVETPLQPGMQVDADVKTDHRRLIEWLFDPLFAITGTWR